MSHRAPLVVPFRWLPQGMCKWCGGFVLREDGTVDRRRTWHRRGDLRDCLGEYKISWPGVFRLRVWQRDAGVCAQCPAGTPPFDTAENPVGWHADHIVPLADGGTWSLDNAQTLCHVHHKEKTARENTQRAHGRTIGEQLAIVEARQ